MTGFNIEHSETGCSCCAEPIELGVKHWLDIRAHIPYDDKALLIFLYHNWIAPDTMYLVFGQIYRILGLYPPDPLFALLQWNDEDEESQE